MTHNHSLFRSLCTHRWTHACSLAPEAPSFWLAFQARPALCMPVFVKVQCSTSGSTLEDKCFSFFWYRLMLAVMTNFEFGRDNIHSKTTESCLLLFSCTLASTYLSQRKPTGTIASHKLAQESIFSVKKKAHMLSFSQRIWKCAFLALFLVGDCESTSRPIGQFCVRANKTLFMLLRGRGRRDP